MPWCPDSGDSMGLGFRVPGGSRGSPWFPGFPMVPGFHWGSRWVPGGFPVGSRGVPIGFPGSRGVESSRRIKINGVLGREVSCIDTYRLVFHYCLGVIEFSTE